MYDSLHALKCTTLEIGVCNRQTDNTDVSLSLQSSAVEQVLDILMDILSWEIAEVVSPCLSHGL